jgi:NAD(P)-dependent dehydrogenase (short-subunit alcohol dehydrogenase family)
MRIEGKVILVTGASQGIGLEIAKALSKKGARVVFASRALDRLRLEAQKAGADNLAVRMDVADPASVRSAIAEIMSEYGRIDILVNNAGQNGRLCRWMEMDQELEREILETHVLGALNVMRSVVPIMQAQRFGIIVNIASIVAWVPMPGVCVYSAAKAAIVAFSEASRAELECDGIDVRVFAPAHTTTGFPIQRPTRETPETVASTFLASLLKGDACTISDEALPRIKRYFPKAAQKIMAKTGLHALDVIADKG